MALIVTDALKFRESENDQFRRLSLSANFNTPVPVSQGGTGADNAADARANLAVLPLAGGTLTGKVISDYTDVGIVTQHGTANNEAGFRAKRTDTDVSVLFGVGSGGVNHGVYSYKLGKWMIYGDGSNVYCNGTATNVTGTVAIGHGGTGATNAATALSNLGALPASTITSGTWTPKIYDYETYRRDMAPQVYIKIGRLYVLFLAENPFQSTTFNTMIQIRNSPCPHMYGGMVYVATVSGQGGTWTVQGSNSNIYLRPNYQGTLSGGWFQGVFFGYGD